MATASNQQMLAFGYIRDCTLKLKLQQTVPSSLCQLIYDFFKIKKCVTALIGHVDSGKSTLIGQLLHHFDAFPVPMDELRSTCSSMGKESFVYAFASDRSRYERLRGITIHGSYHNLCIGGNDISILDCPGHCDYVKNTIRHMAASESVTLVVPASVGQFEATMASFGGTRLHCQIAYSLGIRRVMVLINKMDARGVGWSESRYIECRDEVMEMLKSIGFDTESADSQVLCLPISAWNGDNVTTRSTSMSWYKGFQITGNNNNVSIKNEIESIKDTRYFTVCDAMQHFLTKIPSKTSTKGLLDNDRRYDIEPGIMTINKCRDRCGTDGVLSISMGKVVSGRFHIGDKVQFHPRSGATGIIESIGENGNNKVQCAEKGDIIGMKLKEIKNGPIRSNEVMIQIPSNSENEDIPRFQWMTKRIKRFTVTVRVLNHKVPRCIKPGFSPTIYVNSMRFPVTLVDINSVTKDVSYQQTPKIEETKPLVLKSRDAESAELVFAPKPGHPVLVTPEDVFEPFSRIVIMQVRGKVTMDGVVTEVVYQQ